MINFDVLEKFTKEEILMIMDSINGTVISKKAPVKGQIIANVIDLKEFYKAVLKLEVDDFDELIEKLEALSELEALELSKYIEFSFISDELPLNLSLYVQIINSYLADK